MKRLVLLILQLTIYYIRHSIVQIGKFIYMKVLRLQEYFKIRGGGYYVEISTV